MESVNVAAREAVTDTVAVSAREPVAVGEIDATPVPETVPDALAAAERELDVQPLPLRETPALAEVEPTGERDLLIEPLPVIEGVEGADSEKVMRADAVLLLVEDSEVLGERVARGVTEEQPTEALTLADVARDSEAEGDRLAAPELEKLITERADCDGVDVSDADTPADFDALSASVCEAVAQIEAHAEGDAVGERETAAEALFERDTRALGESELEGLGSDAVAEPSTEALDDTLCERDTRALSDADMEAVASAVAEWLAQGINVKEALGEGEKLCVGVAEPLGERDAEAHPDSLPLKEPLPETEPWGLLLVVVDAERRGDRVPPSERVGVTDVLATARVWDTVADTLPERDTLRENAAEADADTLLDPPSP